MEEEAEGWVVPVTTRGSGPGLSEPAIGLAQVPRGCPLGPQSSPERHGSYFWPGRARSSQDWRAPSPAAISVPQPSVLVTSSARPWNSGCPAAHRPRSQRQPPEAMPGERALTC